MIFVSKDDRHLRMSIPPRPVGIFVQINRIAGFIFPSAASQLSVRLLPKGEESSSNLTLREKYGFVTDATWCFTLTNIADSSLSFQLYAVTKKPVLVARLTIPLKWIEVDTVVQSSYPMMNVLYPEQPIYAFVTIHISKNGKPPFTAPEGKLLIIPQWVSLQQAVEEYSSTHGQTFSPEESETQQQPSSSPSPPPPQQQNIEPQTVQMVTPQPTQVIVTSPSSQPTQVVTPPPPQVVVTPPQTTQQPTQVIMGQPPQTSTPMGVPIQIAGWPQMMQPTGTSPTPQPQGIVYIIQQPGPLGYLPQGVPYYVPNYGQGMATPVVIQQTGMPVYVDAQGNPISPMGVQINQQSR